MPLFKAVSASTTDIKGKLLISDFKMVQGIPLFQDIVISIADTYFTSHKKGINFDKIIGIKENH